MKVEAASLPPKSIARLIIGKASRETFYNKKHRMQKFPAQAGSLWLKTLTFRRLNGATS